MLITYVTWVEVTQVTHKGFIRPCREDSSCVQRWTTTKENVNIATTNERGKHVRFSLGTSLRYPYQFPLFKIFLMLIADLFRNQNKGSWLILKQRVPSGIAWQEVLRDLHGRGLARRSRSNSTLPHLDDSTCHLFRLALDYLQQCRH